MLPVATGTFLTEVGTMTAQAQLADAGSVPEYPTTPSQSMPERRARFLPGIPMLVLGIALIVGAAALFWLASNHPGGGGVAFGWAGVLLILAGTFALRGLTPVAPGRAHVVQ